MDSTTSKQINFLKLVKSTFALFKQEPKLYFKLLVYFFIIVVAGGLFQQVILLIVDFSLTLYAVFASMFIKVFSQGDYKNFISIFAVFKAMLRFILTHAPISFAIACVFSSAYQGAVYNTKLVSERNYFFRIYFQVLFMIIRLWLLPLFILIPICLFTPGLVSMLLSAILAVYVVSYTLKNLVYILFTPYLVFQKGIEDKKLIDQELQKIPFQVSIITYFYTIAFSAVFSIIMFFSSLILGDPLDYLMNISIESSTLGQEFLSVITTPQVFSFIAILLLLSVALFPFSPMLSCVYFDLVSRADYSLAKTMNKRSMLVFVLACSLTYASMGISMLKAYKAFTHLAVLASIEKEKQNK